MPTLRITKTTYSSEHVAPDGSHRFPAGLVVAVAEGAQTVDQDTAKRWVRNGFAEEYQGAPGHVVGQEVRDKSPAELAAQIQALQAELQQRTVQAGGVHVGYVGRAAAGGLAGEAPRDAFPPQGASLPDDQPIGTSPYQDPTGAHPLAVYDLPDAQRTALMGAGFTRPSIIDAASDAELLEVHGVGESTVKRLREAQGRGR